MAQCVCVIMPRARLMTVGPALAADIYCGQQIYRADKQHGPKPLALFTTTISSGNTFLFFARTLDDFLFFLNRLETPMTMFLILLFVCGFLTSSHHAVDIGSGAHWQPLCELTSPMNAASF